MQSEKGNANANLQFTFNLFSFESADGENLKSKNVSKQSFFPFSVALFF